MVSDAGGLAKLFVDIAGVAAGIRVPEPSAGIGALALEVLATGAHVTCVELRPRRALYLAGLLAIGPADVIAADFLSLPITPVFDNVINPPFAKRADIQHTHARRFLKPGGRLVSIMSTGIAFRDDALTVGFRQQCESIKHLPDGSFRESGTDVTTVVVTMSG